jgi:hypothetical protein
MSPSLAAAAAAAAAIATLLRSCNLCSTWWQRGRIFLEQIAADEAFADQAAHRTNKWCAIVQLVGYNAAAVLIFALNRALYGHT